MLRDLKLSPGCAPVCFLGNFYKTNICGFYEVNVPNYEVSVLLAPLQPLLVASTRPLKKDFKKRKEGFLWVTIKTSKTHTIFGLRKKPNPKGKQNLKNNLRILNKSYLNAG